MNPYLEKLKAYLAQWPPELGYDDMSSLLELLCYHFTVTHSIEDAIIRSQLLDVDNILKKLSPQEHTAISDKVCDLCMHYSGLAFAEGARTGARITLELLEDA